jgi:hypothetical protein
MFVQLATAIVAGAIGYIVGAFGGSLLLQALEGYIDLDPAFDAAVAGAFVVGPLLGILAFSVTWAVGQRRDPRYRPRIDTRSGTDWSALDRTVLP